MAEGFTPRLFVGAHPVREAFRPGFPFLLLRLPLPVGAHPVRDRLSPRSSILRYRDLAACAAGVSIACRRSSHLSFAGPKER